jgi:hypothetical protein
MATAKKSPKPEPEPELLDVDGLLVECVSSLVEVFARLLTPPDEANDLGAMARLYKHLALNCEYKAKLSEGFAKKAPGETG